MSAQPLLQGTAAYRLLNAATAPAPARDLMAHTDTDGGMLLTSDAVQSALTRLVRNGWMSFTSTGPGRPYVYTRTPEGAAALTSARSLLHPTQAARLLWAASAEPRLLTELLTSIDPTATDPDSTWQWAVGKNVRSGYLRRFGNARRPSYYALTPKGEAELDRLWRVAQVMQSHCVGYRQAEQIDRASAA